jgi:hypothetical protein
MSHVVTSDNLKAKWFDKSLRERLLFLLVGCMDARDNHLYNHDLFRLATKLKVVSEVELLSRCSASYLALIKQEVVQVEADNGRYPADWLKLGQEGLAWLKARSF